MVEIIAIVSLAPRSITLLHFYMQSIMAFISKHDCYIVSLHVDTFPLS
jgi:hypothetical protein